MIQRLQAPNPKWEMFTVCRIEAPGAPARSSWKHRQLQIALKCTAIYCKIVTKMYTTFCHSHKFVHCCVTKGYRHLFAFILCHHKNVYGTTKTKSVCSQGPESLFDSGISGKGAKQRTFHMP